MECILIPVLAVWLVCGPLVLAQTSSPGNGQKQEPPASNSNSQGSEPVPAATPLLGGIDALSDTEAIDFDPYLLRVVRSVKQNWFKLIPQSAHAPRMMRGEVSIQFVILKTGKTAGMKVVESSGDVQLDHAAWLGISDSRFSPLPAQYSGQYLALRIHFSYNPDKPSDIMLQYRD
jgi:TonB family protein